MITITGKLYNVAITENTDRNTGEVVKVHTAEIIHKSRDKTEIASLKLDESVSPEWVKAIGQDITAEVRFWAMKTREGGIQSGLTPADKKALPVLLRPAKQAA